MNWLEFEKSQPPINPKRMLVIKLWDKVIPIAHLAPYDETYIPVRTVCEMLNLDFEAELEKLLHHDYLCLQTALGSYIGEAAKLLPEPSDFFIVLSALTGWIPLIDPKSIEDEFVRETHYRLMLLLHASMADIFGLEKSGRVLTHQVNLDQDVFETRYT